MLITAGKFVFNHTKPLVNCVATIAVWEAYYEIYAGKAPHWMKHHDTERRAPCTGPREQRQCQDSTKPTTSQIPRRRHRLELGSICVVEESSRHCYTRDRVKERSNPINWYPSKAMSCCGVAAAAHPVRKHGTRVRYRMIGEGHVTKCHLSAEMPREVTGVVLTGNQGPSGALWVGGSASEVMPKMQIRGGSKLNVRRLIGQWVDHVARYFRSVDMYCRYR